MPFRTKDFTLFLLVVAFLVIGITSTVKNNITVKNQGASVISYDENTEVVFEAAPLEPVVDERPSRLAALKEKISKLVLTVPEVVVEETPEETVVENTTPGSINVCAGYTKSALNWSAKGLEFDVAEGARIIFRTIETADTTNELGEVIPSAPTREVVLQLPLRTFASGSNSCLSNDVVGIALDGSLIRNNENKLYQVFGSETVVGYSLDGFPIHGLSTTKTDECGGVMVGGAYRYYLSAEREGVLGCFASVPVRI